MTKYQVLLVQNTSYLFTFCFCAHFERKLLQNVNTHRRIYLFSPSACFDFESVDPISTHFYSLCPFLKLQLPFNLIRLWSVRGFINLTEYIAVYPQ
jgi:hypothetical protein